MTISDLTCKLSMIFGKALLYLLELLPNRPLGRHPKAVYFSGERDLL